MNTKNKKIVITHNTTHYLVIHYEQLIKKFLNRGVETVVVAPLDEKSKSLESIGVKCINVNISRKGLNPFNELVDIFSLARILYKEKPDLLFNFSIKPVIYGSLIGRILKIPKTYSMITGLGYTFIQGGILRSFLKFFVTFLYRLSLKTNACVFFQNTHDRNLFIKNAIIDEKKTTVIPGTGLDMNLFHPGDRKLGNERFIMISRLIAEKGIREYIQAAEKIKKQYANTSFTLAGASDDNPSSIPQSEVQQRAAEGTIDYLGEIDDVCSALQNADIFVLPTYYGEGLPRSLVEAMACGLPIITTDWPGCRDCVQDGVNGFLIPPKDPEALANTMLKFILNPGLVHSMSQKSRELAVEKYELNKVLDQVLNKIVI